MGRKKAKQLKPWCWYCNREFDNERILFMHQKAKHFKCHICQRKLRTGPGLHIHCWEMHKIIIHRVPNSISNRSDIEIEIYGMEGIPEADLIEHKRQKEDSPDLADDKEEEPTPKRHKPEEILSSVPRIMPGELPRPPPPPPPPSADMFPGTGSMPMMQMGLKFSWLRKYNPNNGIIE